MTLERGPAAGGWLPAAEDNPEAALIALLDTFGSLLAAPKRILLENLAVAEARTALDVGCGTGGDAVAMARLMPPGSRAAGVDASETMIAEARRRAGGLGADVTFRVGNALALPYPGGAFDVCRAGNVLQHVTDPGQAIGEMARVTRPGGRVGAMEGDLGTMLLDHQDQPATQAVLGAFAAETAQPWIGRQLPRLFREAGLSGVSAEPVAVLGSHGLFRAILGPTVTRLCDEGLLASEQALHWWSWLAGQHASGRFIGGVTFFAVAGTRPR